MAQIHRTLWFRFLLLTLLSSMAWAQLPVAEDTFVASGTTTPSGTNTNLQVVASPINAALVRFDLTGVPAGTTGNQVTKATVKLYVNTVSLSGSLDVCQVTSPWTEASTVFTGKPTLSATPLATAVPVSTASKYIVVDITTAVKAWQNGTTNNGIALLPSSATPCNSSTYGAPSTSINVKLDSKENISASHDAGLNVVLSLTNGTVTSVGTGEGLTGGPITTSGTISMVPPSGNIALGGVKGPNAAATCAVGSHFSGIAMDGTLTCTPDSAATSLSFSAITSGTNTGQSLTVGSGSSLNPGVGGTITANMLSGGTYGPGVNITGNAGTVNNGVYTTGSYADPSWITSLSGAKISGSVASALFANSAGTTTNFSGTLSGDVTGTQGSTVVSAIGGVSPSNFARLDLANLFGQGKKQTFQPDATNAGLNIAGASADPTTLAPGDLWFNTNDQHLHLRDTNNPQSLAFLSDLTSSNNSLLGSSNHWTGSNQFDDANGIFHGMFNGDGTNLTNVNAALFSGQPIGSFVLQGGNASLSSVTAGSFGGGTFTGSGAGLTGLDAGNVATGILGDARLSNNVALITRPNIFQADNKQTFTAGANYAGLNIAGVANNPQTPTPGDLWLNTGDIHLQFRDNANSPQSLAFLSDISAANSNLLEANNHWTGTNNFDQASGTFNGLFNGSFTGDGSNLSNLTAANITAGGTAAINISGTAASAVMAFNANDANALGNQPATNYARLDIGNAFTGDQTVSGFVNATSSTGDALVGTSTNNAGVSGHGGNGVAGIANGSNGSIGVRGDASVVDGLVHYGVEGVAADTNSIAGVFDHTGGGKILSGRNNNTEVFSVDGNGKITGDGSGLTGVQASTLSPSATIQGSQVSGNISGNATSITGSINGSQVNGNISGNAASITGSITGGQVSSAVANAVLATSATSAGTAAALQGTAVSNTAPTNGQVLQYNTTNTQWQPTDITGNFIQNGTAQQTTASFNIDGTGVVGGSLTAGGAILPLTASGNSKPSFPLDFKATGNTGTSNMFRLLADGTGATPVFDFQTCSGTSCTPASTGLSIDNTGKITFATGQTFPAANFNGTLAIANGGTGQTTQQAAINALTGTQVAGKYLRSDGTNATLSSIQTADVPTLNQNTTGSAASFTGNLAGDVTGTQAATALSATGVTAGTYTLANITVDAKGRISAAGSGSVTFPVSSVFGRTGAVVAQSGDYTFDKIAAGSNTNALTVGTGGSLAPTGTGTVTANSLSSTLISSGSGSAGLTASSTTYAPPASGTAASVAVNVSGTHKVLVTLTATCTNTNNKGCWMSFDASGGLTQSASDNFALGASAIMTGPGASFATGASYLVTVTGNTTFTAKYRVDSASTATFGASSIIVQVF